MKFKVDIIFDKISDRRMLRLWLGNQFTEMTMEEAQVLNNLLSLNIEYLTTSSSGSSTTA